MSERSHDDEATDARDDVDEESEAEPTSMEELLAACDSAPPAPDGPDDQPEPCELFDAQIAAAMLADAAHDDMKMQMRRLGERIGALYTGMLDEGVMPEHASELAHTWMLNAVFQATARETGTLGM